MPQAGLRMGETIRAASRQIHDFSWVDVSQNLSTLDYLPFDVGFGYRMEGGVLSVLKSGCYGVS